jgi:nucleotide-binding universal stress UspA family protein
MEKQGLQSAQEFLNTVAAKLTALGYKTRTLAVLGAPATMILREAAKQKPDVIVAGTHGHKGISRFVLGSVSHALLHSASYPVLVYH